VKNFVVETDVARYRLEIDDHGEVRYSVYTRTADFDIPWQCELQHVVLDPIDQRLIRNDVPGIAPGLLVWLAQGCLAGQVFVIQIPDGTYAVKEGIFLTTILGGQGFHHPQGDVLYFDSTHWFRIVQPENIVFEVARYLVTFPLFDRELRSLRAVTLPSGRPANFFEIRAGVECVDSVWNTENTLLKLKRAAAASAR
jgi:hypothetical protein